MGQSPFADPAYLNNLIEHLKQHMTLWYLNRSNGYVQEATGKPVNDYENPNYTPVIDKLYTTVGAHVMLDVSEVMGQFMPAFQQLLQMAQQRNQKQPQLPPDAQVVQETSMAETQRKTQKDQQDAQLAQARLAYEVHKAQMENQTKIEIENAKLTHKTIGDVIGAQPPQAQPAPQPQVPPQQGEQNGNIGL